MRTSLVALCVLLLLTPVLCTTESSRIVGGKVAGKKIRKRLANIIITLKNGGLSGCTGSVYHRRWILTAAHCVDGMDVSSSFAYISPKSASAFLDKKKYYFSKVYMHKWYRPSRALRNDIAMIKLEDKISFKIYYPIKVGRPPKDGTEVIAGGYGVLNEEGEEAEYAMQTKLTAQSFETCKDIEFDDVQKHLSERTHVCATSLGFPDEGRTDTCYGDSGGPVFKEVKGKLVQYGITSFSTTGCAAPGGTPWYVRLATYNKHLKKLVKNGKSNKFKRVK